MKRFYIPIFLIIVAGIVLGAGLAHLFPTGPIVGVDAKNELSKEEAKSILSQNPSGKLMRTINKNPLIKSIDPRDKEILEKMQAAGYLSLKKVSGKNAKGSEARYQITATSKLSPFIANEDAETINVKLADLIVDQVTVVVTKGDEADATYMTKLELTPVADIYAPVHNPSPGPNHAIFKWVDGKWK